MCKGLWDGAYGLSSLSEKTRKSNHLQMLLQRQHFLLNYLKTLSVGPARVWTYGPMHAQQTGANPIELTGRRLDDRRQRAQVFTPTWPMAEQQISGFVPFFEQKIQGRSRKHFPFSKDSIQWKKRALSLCLCLSSSTTRAILSWRSFCVCSL